jgi:tetratricopeptide (TPR) repeat protein
MNPGASIPELERRLAAAPASPLFARLAGALLARGEAARAEALCERGVGLYPHYTTGLLVHARCMAARGRYAEARLALEAVAAGYPGNLVLADLGEEWRSRVAGESAVDAADDVAVFTDIPDHAETMDGDGAEPPAPVPTKHAGTVPILQPVPPSLNRTSFIEADRIVSRTLAEIYASQGAIGEAVETYRILLERMPGRSERLEERLRELEDRMKTDAGPRPVRVE